MSDAVERATKWNKEHPERRKEICQGYYKNSKERILGYQREYYQGLKWEVLVHYSEGGYPACAVCNEQRLPCLSIDHINNDGARERKRLGKEGAVFYRWLRDNGYPEGYQVLCMNCQFIKGDEERRKARCIM